MGGGLIWFKHVSLNFEETLTSLTRITMGQTPHTFQNGFKSCPIVGLIGRPAVQIKRLRLFIVQSSGSERRLLLRKMVFALEFVLVRR
jgi:hypothetical protein